MKTLYSLEPLLLLYFSELKQSTSRLRLAFLLSLHTWVVGMMTCEAGLWGPQEDSQEIASHHLSSKSNLVESVHISLELLSVLCCGT